jgi:hypothetical protein
LSTCLTSEESKTLLALCRAGKLYDVERWIASGKSVCTSPSIKKTPLLTAIETGFHSLVELLARNEPHRSRRTAPWLRGNLIESLTRMVGFSLSGLVLACGSVEQKERDIVLAESALYDERPKITEPRTIPEYLSDSHS